MGRNSTHQDVCTGARYSTVKLRSFTVTSSSALPCLLASICRTVSIKSLPMVVSKSYCRSGKLDAATVVFVFKPTKDVPRMATLLT